MASSARVADDEDFATLKRLIDADDGWDEVFTDGNIRVCAEKGQARGGLRGVRVTAALVGVSAAVLYDVLHDADFRTYWDHNLLHAEDIGHIDVNNDVGYYAISCPAPLKNRDFVLQRSWLDMGSEKIILSKSVHHKDFPPRKGFVRAISLLTGYVLRERPDGCWFGYYSRADPKGQIPSWIVNKVTNMLAPKVVKKLHEAALKYPGWKVLCDRPYYKPWLYPEQVPSSRIAITDCLDPESVGAQVSSDSLTHDRESSAASYPDLSRRAQSSRSPSVGSQAATSGPDETTDFNDKAKSKKFFKLVKKSMKHKKGDVVESEMSGVERKTEEHKSRFDTSKIRRRLSLAKQRPDH